jgi:ubiquinone/menaquinone biosynthesis C-methylase UbiE
MLTRGTVPRRPEPNLVMADAGQVAAFNEAGGESGVMAPVYLFHAAQISDVLRPGDYALDLACGPANQLAQVARLWPEVSFTGIDLSDGMLERARAHAAAAGLANVAFRKGDIADLSDWADDSVDAVFSTMSLHHLPDEARLAATFREAARVLKPGGGLYLVDFGRLAHERSLRYFAYQYADRQPAVFTEDYLNSLRAAFSRDAFRQAGAVFEPRAGFHSTFLMPYMVAWKGAARGQVNNAAREGLAARRRELPRHQRRDLKDLKRFFGLGGLTSRYLD